MKKYLFLLIIFLIPMKVHASSMIAYEMNSDRILYSDNIHEKRSVASISKIMTAILACESGKLDDIVTIGNEISSSYGSAVYIKEGEQMSLRDLVYGLMLRSGNDASYAIASYVGGNVDNFIKMMNNKAKELGMKNTLFNNPNGLDSNGGNISTSYDMAILTSYAMKNNDYKTITGTKKHIVKTNMNYYSWINKNRLLFSYKYTTGGKTGYTDIAKRTLVTTATINDMDIVIVTLNDGNDFNDHKNKYEELSKIYTGYKVLKKGDISILNLDNKDRYYIKNDVIYPLDNLEKDNISIKFVKERDSNINDDKIGKLNVYLGNKKIKDEEVYINIDKKVSFWRKIINLFNHSNTNNIENSVND